MAETHDNICSYRAKAANMRVFKYPNVSRLPKDESPFLNEISWIFVGYLILTINCWVNMRLTNSFQAESYSNVIPHKSYIEAETSFHPLQSAHNFEFNCLLLF